MRSLLVRGWGIILLYTSISRKSSSLHYQSASNSRIEKHLSPEYCFSRSLMFPNGTFLPSLVSMSYDVHGQLFGPSTHIKGTKLANHSTTFSNQTADLHEKTNKYHQRDKLHQVRQTNHPDRFALCEHKIPVQQCNGICVDSKSC